MSETTTTEEPVENTVAQLKDGVLPALFQDPRSLGEYGAAEDNIKALNSFSDLMESGAVSGLARKVGEIVEKLADADPGHIAKKPSWLCVQNGRA